MGPYVHVMGGRGAIGRDAVISALRPVQDPELRRSIVDLGLSLIHI